MCEARAPTNPDLSYLSFGLPTDLWAWGQRLSCLGTLFNGNPTIPQNKSYPNLINTFPGTRRTPNTKGERHIYALKIKHIYFMLSHIRHVQSTLMSYFSKKEKCQPQSQYKTFCFLENISPFVHAPLAGITKLINNSHFSPKNSPLSSLPGGKQGVLLSVLVSAKRDMG